MTELFIDDPSLKLLRKELLKENAFAIRIFIGGGGCCTRLELIPVKKALAGDITFMIGGLRILVEKEIVENTSGILIKYDEHKGLLIDLT